MLVKQNRRDTCCFIPLQSKWGIYLDKIIVGLGEISMFNL